MRRREFIAGVGGAAAWPLAARAQQPALPVIGFLNSQSLEARRERVAAFHRGLADTGYVEGQNVAIEYRWAEGRNDRLPQLAGDLARRQVSVIAADGAPSALAAKAATQTIPIVFLTGSDPVEIGLVGGLNRPGGTLTGLSILATEVTAKRVQILHELVPAAAVIGLLVNPTNPNFESETREARIAARTLGVLLLVLNASHQSEIEAAFATLVQQRAGALVVGEDPFFLTQRDQLVALAARNAVPAIYVNYEVPVAGGLMS
jgi:putative ABC transport system substrate-binding protein